LESVAYEYAGYLRVLLELHPELQPDETRVIGGGARSAIWNRIKSSVLGIPFVRLNRAEFSCWGAALVAGHAVGMFDDLALAATTSTAVAERYHPDPEEHATYAQMAEQYYTVLAALTAPSKALAALQSQGSFVKASA
jgi:xylulokinase